MKTRHKKIAFILVGLLAVGGATALVLSALKTNIVFFYTPSQVAAKEAPGNRAFRVGGLVEKGSHKRNVEGLGGRFIVTDTSQSIPVVYEGSVPDLFKEGRGCVVEGSLGSDGVFHATQVLAKHDENYMPPEAGKAIDEAKAARSLVK
ncbi:MAG: cytochrome c biosis protein CcmE [Acidobacteria bacterium]|nr:cytochrome c biosis protein CcmE [Acidobacteriota bacterium]